MRRLFVLTGLLAPFSVLAQSATTNPGPEITVTAYRTAQALENAGSAVSLIDRDAIRTRQSAVAADALRAVPGVSLARSGPLGAQTQLRMRGAEGNQVLVLIDGVEANDIATNDEFSFEHLTTFDIERIEVVRGPQSALWGSDALAGVINVVTRRPSSPQEADAFLESGADGFLNGGARVGFGSERASLAISGSHLRTDGTNASRTGGEDDGYDNTTFNVVGSALVLPFLTLDLSARHTRTRTDFDNFGSVDGELIPVDADSSTDADQGYLRSGARASLFGGRWTHELHYAITDTSTDTRSETGPGFFDSSSVDGNKYGAYYQTSLQVVPGHQLTLALSSEREEFSQRGTVQSYDFDEDGAPDLVLDPNQDESVHAKGYAAEYLAEVTRDLVLSASLRRDDYSDFDDVTTWRTTASWRLPDTKTRLHASLGTGQKTPTFVERFGFYPGQFAGNATLDPETSTGWDTGIERRWLDGRLVTDLTYFRADLEDEINGFDCSAGFPCTASNRDGTSHRKGLEFSAAAELAAGYSLDLAYTYTDATEPDTDSGARSREVRRPLHSGSLNLTGRLLQQRLTLNLGAYYTGEREDVVALDTFTPPYTRRATLDSYMLLRLAASYEVTGNLSLYGRIENALDEDYEDVYGFRTPGAQAYVGVRMALQR